MEKKRIAYTTNKTSSNYQSQIFRTKVGKTGNVLFVNEDGLKFWK